MDTPPLDPPLSKCIFCGIRNFNLLCLHQLTRACVAVCNVETTLIVIVAVVVVGLVIVAVVVCVVVVVCRCSRLVCCIYVLVVDVSVSAVGQVVKHNLLLVQPKRNDEIRIFFVINFYYLSV